MKGGDWWHNKDTMFFFYTNKIGRRKEVVGSTTKILFCFYIQI
jgi:hypothetical protein